MFIARVIPFFFVFASGINAARKENYLEPIRSQFAPDGAQYLVSVPGRAMKRGLRGSRRGIIRGIEYLGHTVSSNTY